MPVDFLPLLSLTVHYGTASPSPLLSSHSFLTLLTPFLTPPFTQLLPQLIEPWFIFALIWSVGATCDGSGRKKFDTFLREKMKEVICACFVCVLYCYLTSVQ